MWAGEAWEAFSIRNVHQGFWRSRPGAGLLRDTGGQEDHDGPTGQEVSEFLGGR